MADVSESGLLVHTVTIEPRTAGPTGVGYGAPADCPAWVSEDRKLVINGDGEEVTAEVTAFLSLADGPDVHTGDRITTPTGRVVHALAVTHRTDAGLGAWQHIEVNAS